MAEYKVRRLTREEINTAVDWAADEGWNPGLNDAGCFYNIDPTGWWGGFFDDKLIATISAVDYGKLFAFVGFYIVHPDYRGKGYGYKLWQESLASIAERNIGLDGVVSEQENYKKSGFKLAYRNMRYEGTARHTDSGGSNIRVYKPEDFNAIVKFDRKFFPDERNEFLACWMNMNDSVTLCSFNKETLTGFGTIRKCRKGYKIGPLFCNTNEIAESLYQQLQNQIEEGEGFYLDIPEPNEAAKLLVEKYNMNFVFETARMYTGDDPQLPVDNIFGVTTFELG